jgi:hypothetical protein
MTDGVQRWYRGYRTVGKSSQLVHQIGTAVRTLDLGRHIPVVRLEKRARGQFYVFVAVESAGPGVIPPEVEGFLSLPILGNPLPMPFRLEDIRSMVGGDMDVHDYARRLPYKAPERFLSRDPFDTNSDAEMLEVDDASVLAASQVHERLLTWLSAVGQGSWGTFRSACRALGLERDGKEEAQRVLRKLRLLGHSETSRDGTRWTIAPKVLARVEAGERPTTYVLCGARDAGLLAALSEVATMEITPQGGGAGPASAAFRVEDPATLRPRLAERGLANQVVVADEAAARLAEALPPIEHWLDLLDPLPALNCYMYECRRFDGQGFVPEVFSGQSGFYELWRPSTSTATVGRFPDYKAFYDARSDRWLRGDWYGMRFIAHVFAGQACPAEFDPSSGRLAIPSEWRLPEVYERVLVLASGRLPSPTARYTWLTYEGISEPLLDVLASRLQLDLSILAATA